MAQLTDDCFAFSGPLLPVEEVERIIRERVTPVAEIETVPLHAASGRVIARKVVAPIDLPPFDNSAVDGYAVRHADLDANADAVMIEHITLQNEGWERDMSVVEPVEPSFDRK